MNEKSKKIQDELKEIAPVLSTINKQQKNAPAFYFENMQHRVLNEISVGKNESSLFDKWLNTALQIFQPKYVLPFATITVLFVVATVLHMPKNNFMGTLNKPMINKQAIRDFLTEEELSIDVISSNMNNNEVSKLTLLFASNAIQKNNIKDYILDDIDESFSDEMSL